MKWRKNWKWKKKRNSRYIRPIQKYERKGNQVPSLSPNNKWRRNNKKVYKTNGTEGCVTCGYRRLLSNIPVSRFGSNRWCIVSFPFYSHRVSYSYWILLFSLSYSPVLSFWQRGLFFLIQLIIPTTATQTPPAITTERLWQKNIDFSSHDLKHSDIFILISLLNYFLRHIIKKIWLSVKDNRYNYIGFEDLVVVT